MSTKTDPRPAEASEVRQWARDKGIEVSKRGLISGDVIKQFNRAKRGRVVFVTWSPWDARHNG